MKSPEFCRKLHFYQERLRRGREAILESDIKLGYGTDLVAVHESYESGWEYSAWLRSGADPFRALQAATKKTTLKSGGGKKSPERSKKVNTRTYQAGAGTFLKMKTLCGTALL